MLAFIFDIDGTLVDSNELHVDSWDRRIPPVRQTISSGSYVPRSAKVPTNICPSFLRRTRSTVSAKRWMITGPICSKKNISRSATVSESTELFQRIRDDNKRIVLASSGKKADTKYYIDLLKIDDLIEGYTSGDDADNSKPAPDIFAASLKKLGSISSADAVTVGDTRFDIEAARKAGLTTIAFLCGGTSESVLRGAGAVAIRRDPADFLAHYDELMTDVSPSQK